MKNFTNFTGKHLWSLIEDRKKDSIIFVFQWVLWDSQNSYNVNCFYLLFEVAIHQSGLMQNIEHRRTIYIFTFFTNSEKTKAINTSSTTEIPRSDSQNNPLYAKFWTTQRIFTWLNTCLSKCNNEFSRIWNDCYLIAKYEMA